MDSSFNEGRALSRSFHGEVMEIDDLKPDDRLEGLLVESDLRWLFPAAVERLNGRGTCLLLLSLSSCGECTAVAIFHL